MRATTSLPRASSISVTSTAAPSRARVSEQASPIPDAPPVTMAAFPASCAIGGSAALPVAGPALRVGLDALLEVLGLAQPVLLDELALRRDLGGISKATSHGLARRKYGERRALGDLGGELDCRLAHV